MQNRDRSPRLADRWLATIPALADHELRVRVATTELQAAARGTVAESLDELCARAEQSEDLARETLIAFVPVVVDPAQIGWVAELRAKTTELGLLAAGRLLRCSTPGGHLPPPRSRREDHAEQEAQSALTHGDGRPLTLGERRALARRPSRHTLHRMMQDPNPMVVRIVLNNPKITEEDVVRMAARRPAVPSVLCEIAKTWTLRPRVRLTVALNPGAPPAVAVPLLSLLAAHELRQIIRSTQLSAVVRATANEIVAVRPPPENDAEPPALPH
jgi:hypothetical protein